LLKELSALGQRLGTLHSDLLSSPVAKSFHGKHSAEHGEIGISNLSVYLKYSSLDDITYVLARKWY